MLKNFTEVYTRLYQSLLEAKSIPCKVIKLESAKQAQELANTFGTFGIYHNGSFITQELLTEKKFMDMAAQYEESLCP